MFQLDKQLYVTRAITEDSSSEHHFFIFKYLHEQQASLTDYLQVFEFYIENGKQRFGAWIKEQMALSFCLRVTTKQVKREKSLKTCTRRAM